MDNRVLTPARRGGGRIKDPAQPWKQSELRKGRLICRSTTCRSKPFQSFCQISKRKENPTDEPLWQMLEFKLVNDEVAQLDEMNFLGLLCKVRGGQANDSLRISPGQLLDGYWDELEIFRCADGCQTLAKS